MENGVSYRSVTCLQPTQTKVHGKPPSCWSSRGKRKILLRMLFASELTGTGKYTGEMAAWLAASGHGVEVLDAWRVTSLCGKWHNRLTYILL